jgi:hypothetical protein
MMFLYSQQQPLCTLFRVGILLRWQGNTRSKQASTPSTINRVQVFVFKCWGLCFYRLRVTYHNLLRRWSCQAKLSQNHRHGGRHFSIGKLRLPNTTNRLVQAGVGLLKKMNIRRRTPNVRPQCIIVFQHACPLLGGAFQWVVRRC